MGRKPKTLRLADRKIWINEWIEVIPGATQGGAANAAGVRQSYISNMGSQRRSNPSARIMLAISEYLGVTINDLYRAPPSPDVLESISRLSPAARKALLRKPKTS